MPHSFCQKLLAETMKDVRKAVPVDQQKEAWAYNYHNGYCEFQIPSQRIYWYGQACCLWHAKHRGWESYLWKLEREAE